MAILIGLVVLAVVGGLGWLIVSVLNKRFKLTVDDWIGFVVIFGLLCSGVAIAHVIGSLILGAVGATSA